MEVLLKPPRAATELLSDLTDMDRNPLRPDAWPEGGVVQELPADAWFEYVWRMPDGSLQLDAENGQTAPSIWYGRVSVITGPDYRPDPLALASESVPPGPLRREKLDSAALGHQRRVNTWTPAGFENASLPAILVQDGTAFNRLGRLSSVMQLLLDEGVPPARLVFLEPVDRTSEYSFSENFNDFMLQELLPKLEELAGPTDSVSLLGTSLGGLASAGLALAAPERFRGVATLSAAILGGPADRDPYNSREEWLLKQVQAGAGIPRRWFVGTGSLEWLHQPNLRLQSALAARGTDLAAMVLSAGHNWPNWRDMEAAALRQLLG